MSFRNRKPKVKIINIRVYRRVGKEGVMKTEVRKELVMEKVILGAERRRCFGCANGIQQGRADISREC